MIYFSVIIPLFNKAKTIQKTLESVLIQSYPHFEIIVVDDGSMDDGPEIVQSLDNPKIRLIRKENGGPGSARNRGIQEARYPWIVFLDADDLMLEDALGHFAEALDPDPYADMVVGNFLLAHGKESHPYHTTLLDTEVKDPFFEWFMKRLMPCAGTYACKKIILSRYPYKEELKRSEDTEVLFNVFRASKILRTNATVMSYQRDYSVESRKKTGIEQDFQGHLSFDSWKSLWERICLYELYVEAKNNYHEEVGAIYPNMEKEFFLKAAYHLAFRYRAWQQRKQK